MSFFVSESIKDIVKDVETELENNIFIPIEISFVDSGDRFQVNSIDLIKKTARLTLNQHATYKFLHNVKNKYSIELSLFGHKCLDITCRELKFNQIEENDNNLIDLEILIKE